MCCVCRLHVIDHFDKIVEAGYKTGGELGRVAGSGTGPVKGPLPFWTAELKYAKICNSYKTY